MNLNEKTSLYPCKTLLPNGEIDLTKWSTVACDQFTSEAHYWNELEEIVGDSPSCLNITLPEIYLGEGMEDRITKINATIRKYLADGVFNQTETGFILTVRKTPFVERRIGLIATVDLEQYDFKAKSNALIRATEGTITERIPPRLKIRKNADIELTHIMLLYDDLTRSINEKLYENRSSYEKIYDFTLNMNGGSIEGYFIKDCSEVVNAFANLLNEDLLVQKYGVKTPFLFAVGDGNHSLATAKTHWDNVKETLTEKQRKNHPARYALVEIVNVHDDGIHFEPIHRYVTGVDADKFINGLNEVKGDYFAYSLSKEFTQSVGVGLVQTLKNIDEYIKDYIAKNGGVVDYVHGDANVKTLANENKGSVAILVGALEKTELFRYVATVGSLPRKTFSMGEGEEKRYYLEAKYIVTNGEE